MRSKGTGTMRELGAFACTGYNVLGHSPHNQTFSTKTIVYDLYPVKYILVVMLITKIIERKITFSCY